MPLMVLTAEVFQADKSWLNDFAVLNISLISVTKDVSQDEIFPLKSDALSNTNLKVVTADVFQ
ncbi:hypothetical protein ACHAXM_000362, partial [Skeletonema potamos]